MNDPVVGEMWIGDALAGEFAVTGQPEALPGLGEWRNAVFVGHRARRTSDNAHALVGLTKKPNAYPYDWVLI